MSFFCSISGEPPQVPVISPKSGLVYEKRLIVAHINQHGTEPSTGEALAEDELVAVKTNPNAAPPRPPSLTSIPALLHTLQSEWDSLVLETHALRTQYNATRQELAHALYQADAATRVVARLVRERDEAREALSNVRAATGMGAGPTEMNDTDVEMAGGVEPDAVPQDILDTIDQTHKALSATRKKRKTPAVPSPARLPESPKTFAAKTPVTAFGVAASSTSMYATGSTDGIVRVWDGDDMTSESSGHRGAVTALEWVAADASPMLITGSEDTTIRFWAGADYAHSATLPTHSGPITGLSIHPSRALLLSSSADGTYALHSLATQKLISRSAPSGTPYSSLALHPDGVLLAVGLQTAPTIQIFDIRSRQLAATFDMPAGAQGSSGMVGTMSFSENGYSLASACPGSEQVPVWDLRKLDVSRTIAAPFAVSSVAYDVSAAYLALAGEEGLGVWVSKTASKAWGSEEGTGAAVVKWGAESTIWGAGADGVKLWASE